MDVWKTRTLFRVTFTTWTEKHPVCEGSFCVSPPVQTNKLYLSSQKQETTWRRRTILQTAVLATTAGLFSWRCRTQSQTVVTLSWHGDTCTAAHPKPRLSAPSPALGPSIGRCHARAEGRVIWVPSLAQRSPFWVGLQLCWVGAQIMEVAVGGYSGMRSVVGLCSEQLLSMDHFINITGQKFEGLLQTN